MIVNAKGKGPRGGSHTVTEKKVEFSNIVGSPFGGELPARDVAVIFSHAHIEMRGGNYNVQTWIGRDEVFSLAAWMLEGQTIGEALTELSKYFEELKKFREIHNSSESVNDIDDEADGDDA